MTVWALFAATLLGAVFHPVETDEPLHNPYKGWVFIDHAVPGEIDAGRSVPRVADGTAYEWYQNVAVLSTWAFVEPRPGEFDWALMDEAIGYWAGQGKTIHLRFSTEDFGVFPGCPRWLFDMGVPKCERGHLSFPDYRHVVYRERLRMFLAAFARKFGDDPRIETINLQGYGEFGEWHSGFNYETVDARVDALRGIVDQWREAFGGRKYLNLSVSYEWRTPANVGESVLPRGTSIYEAFPPSYHDYLHRSVFDYALPFDHVTVSRHGCGGAVKQEYDGRLIAAFFHQYRKPLFMELFGGPDAYRGPGITGFPTTREGDDHVQNALDEVISHHPNYVTPLGWGSFLGATEFYNDNRDLVLAYHKLMGYRFVLVEAVFPETVVPGGELWLEQQWENRAAGRCYEQFPVAVYLIRDGAVAWRGLDEAFDQRHFAAGETYRHRSAFTLPPDLPEGDYEVRLAMARPDGAPALALAMEGGDAEKRYLLGTLRIGNGAPAPRKNAPGAVAVRQDPAGRWITLDPLPGGISYEITFRYAVAKDPVKDLNEQDPGYFRFYARGTDDARLDEVRWYDKAGQPSATRTVFVHTESAAAYDLEWEAVGGGALDVSEVRAVPLRNKNVRLLDVRTAAAQLHGNARFEQPHWIAAHRERDDVTLPDDWQSCLATNPEQFPLKPGTVYTVSFDCAARPQLWQGDYSYLAVERAESAPDARCAFFRWTQRHTASPVRRVYSFRTGPQGDYRLVWGLHNGGEMRVGRVLVVEH